MRAVIKRAASASVTVALCGGGVALAVLAVPLASYESGATDEASTGNAVVSVTSREIDLASAATVALQWSEDSRIRLPAVSGLVTAVSAQAGVEVACGSEVAKVDGRALLAYCGPGPLFRDLSSRSTGDDAAEFVAFLQTVGSLPADEVSSNQINQAIRDLQTAAGWKVTGVVTPNDFVWIESPFVPSGVLVEPGMTVAPAAEVLQVAPVLEQATVTIGNGTSLTLDASAALVFRLDGSESAPSAVSNGQLTDPGSLETELLARAVDGVLPASAVGSIRLPEPRLALTVPATAVTSGDSSECVTVRNSAGDRPVAVTVVGSSVGVVYIEGSILDGDEVLVAPDGSTRC